MIKYYYLIISALLLIGIVSCSKNGDKTESKVEVKSGDELTAKGKELFNTPSNLTGLKCADCHYDGTNKDNLNTKYFADVIGADKRQSVFAGTIKGEDVKSTASGTTVCWETFVKMGRQISPQEISAFSSYFASLKGDSKNLNYTTIALPKPDKLRLKEDQTKIAGLTPDIKNGERIFKETCGFCHGGRTVKHVPSLFEDFDGNLKSIVYHIRMGAKFMPFYPYEIISDQEIADISEYILKNQKK
ncbi:MAG: c-type cytochrome [Bacteroidetes bacterium]|nr:c-type cytochrome [Bacteroidota bacterium]